MKFYYNMMTLQPSFRPPWFIQYEHYCYSSIVTV